MFLKFFSSSSSICDVVNVVLALCSVVRAALVRILLLKFFTREDKNLRTWHVLLPRLTRRWVSSSVNQILTFLDGGAMDSLFSGDRKLATQAIMHAVN